MHGKPTRGQLLRVVALAVACIWMCDAARSRGAELAREFKTDRVGTPIAFSSDDTLLLTSGRKHTREGGESWLAVWDIAADHQLARLPISEMFVWRFAAFLPGNQRIASYDGSIGGLRIWNFRTGSRTRVANAECSGRRGVVSASFSADRKLVASAQVIQWPKSVVRVQRVEDASEIARWELGGVARELVFSPDGKSVLATDEQTDRHNKRMILHVVQWSLDGAQKATRRGPFPMTGFHRRDKPSWYLGRYCLSCDGRVLATTLPENGLLLIDVATLRQAKVGPHETALTLAALNRRPVFGGPFGTLISSLAFTPNGYFLATTAYGSPNVCFWPVSRNRRFQQIEHAEVDEVSGVLFSDSGNRMAVLGSSGQTGRRSKLFIWRID